MHCRTANKGDVAKLSTVAMCVWINTYATDGVTHAIAEHVRQEFALEKIEELIDTKRVYVAEKNGNAVGYVVLSEGIHDTEIQNIYVLPRFQGLGFGTKLLNYLTERHGKLWLSCWAKNEQALRFYTSRGFVKTGTTSFKLGGESHLNYIMGRGT